MGVNAAGRFDNVLNAGFLSKKIPVGTTEVEAKVGGSRQVSRQEVFVFNASKKTIFIGPSGVTKEGTGDNDGVPLEPGEAISYPFGNDTGLFMIAASAANDVIVWEIA